MSLFRSEFERDVLPRKLDECVGALRVVLDEDSTNADCSEESAYVGQVLAVTPVNDRRDVAWVGDATSLGAHMTNDESSRRSEVALRTGEGSFRVLDSLEDPVDVYQVLPDVTADALVLRVGLVTFNEAGLIVVAA